MDINLPPTAKEGEPRPQASMEQHRDLGEIVSFQVEKRHLPTWRWVSGPAGDGTLKAGEILVAISRLAWTANNVTYARLGEQLSYWKFFPAPDGWGRIPAWGVGTIVRSHHPAYRESEGVYGFFPMDSHVVLLPGSVEGVRFVEESPHRRALPPTYNEYVLIDRDAGYDRAHANAHLVLRPLFSLSFFCDAFLREARYFGARQIILTSASSKTGLGLAFLLSRERSAADPIEIVGLTAPGNVPFVDGSGLYDRVLAYEAIESLATVPSVLVDLAGDAGSRAAIHRRLGHALRHSALAGLTHGDIFADAAADLPGPKPVLFFTPDHILRLRREWGADALRQRLAAAWTAFLGFVEPWLQYEYRATRDGIERAYADVLAGGTPATRAYILSIPAGA
jgi:Protein of unknown function (DUF2855)